MIAAKTRRAGGREGKDARHSLRKVAQGRCMTDKQRAFDVGEVLHALVFQHSAADVSFLPLEELGEKPKLHGDGLGDLVPRAVGGAGFCCPAAPQLPRAAPRCPICPNGYPRYSEGVRPGFAGQP